MSDIYQKWNEQGIVRKKLLSLSFMVNAGIPIKEICKHVGISIKEFAELRKKYKDLGEATSEENIVGLMFCIENLVDMAGGYTQKKTGKEGYKNRSGQDRFKIIDIDIPVPKSLQANAYLLEKTQDKKWALNYGVLALQERKLEDKEWEDEPDECDDDVD